MGLFDVLAGADFEARLKDIAMGVARFASAMEHLENQQRKTNEILERIEVALHANISEMKTIEIAINEMETGIASPIDPLIPRQKSIDCP